MAIVMVYAKQLVKGTTAAEESMEPVGVVGTILAGNLIAGIIQAGVVVIHLINRKLSIILQPLLHLFLLFHINLE